MIVYTFVMLCLPSQSPPAVDIEGDALRQRRLIRTISASVAVSTYQATRKPERIEAKYKIWVDGDRHRVDALRDDKRQPVYRELTCRGCEGPNYYLNWAELPEESLVLHFRKIAEVRRRDIHNLINLRALGCSTCDFATLCDRNIDSFIGLPGRTDLAVSSGTYSGRPCVIVSGVMAPRTHRFETTFLPDCANAVVRVCTHGELRGKKWSKVVESELADADQGVWFPKKCHYEQKIDGKLFERETVSLTDVKINTPIDPAVFTLAGMNIPPGTGVITPDSKEVKFWNGTTSSPRDPAREEDFEPQPPPQRLNPGFWLSVFFALVAATATAVVFFRRSRSRL